MCSSDLNDMVQALCEKFKIEHHNSSPYRPQMNGAVEAANKNIKKIVQKIVTTKEIIVGGSKGF